MNSFVLHVFYIPPGISHPGVLQVGMSRHRAILAKLALAWVGIASAIRRTSDDGKVLLFHEDATEFLVNLTDRPGELTVLGQGGPPSHSSHPTPPASPRMSPHPLQETSSFESRHVGGAGGSGLANVRVGSSPSLAMLVGGAAGTVRGSSISSATPVPGASADGAEGLSAEVPQGGESSASGNSGLRAALLQRSAGTAGLDSPHADGGSVPLDPFGRGSSGGGVSTPPRAMSPGPTTFINRMPNPFTGGRAGVPAIVDNAAAPMVVAWPFSQPEICTVAVRIQGHGRVAPAVGGASTGGRRRGDDGAGGKERGDVLFLSTGSSGLGGGTGSFFGGEHMPHALGEAPVHPRSPPLPLPVSTPPSAAVVVMENEVGGTYGAGATLAELAPAMAPASFDASIGVGAATKAELPSSVSAPVPQHGAAAAQRAHHSGHFVSAFDGDADPGRRSPAAAIAIKSHSYGQVHALLPHAYTSPPSRPPIAPRASMSPPTGSPRRVTFDQAPDPGFERVPSSGRSVRSGVQSPTAPPPDLQPDTAAMQLSGLASEEMPWWGGSSRLEGSILVSERSRGSSEQIQHTDLGSSPLSTRAATPEPDSEWGETPTSRTAKFPTIPEAPEPAPRAAALPSAFSGGSGTTSVSGDEWKWDTPDRCAGDGPAISGGLATVLSGRSSKGGKEGGASASPSPSKAAVLASPFGDSEDEAECGSVPVGGGGGPPGVVSGGTAAVLASPFGDDSSGDDNGSGTWGSGGGATATATAFASPFQEDEVSSWAPAQAGSRGDTRGNGAVTRSESSTMPWRKEGSVRVGVVPSLMSPFGGDGDDDDDEGAPPWYSGRGQSREWDTTASTASADQTASTGDGTAAVPNGRAGAGVPLHPARNPGRPRSSSAHRRTYPFSRKPPSRAGYSSSTDDEIATEIGGSAAALQVASVAGGGSTAPAESAQPSLGASGVAEMSGAISLDYQSAVLPSAEANLRALVANKPVHTMEAQFRMWINSSDITMTEEVIGRGSYGQVRPCPGWLLRGTVVLCRTCVALQHLCSWVTILRGSVHFVSVVLQSSGLPGQSDTD